MTRRRLGANGRIRNGPPAGVPWALVAALLIAACAIAAVLFL